MIHSLILNLSLADLSPAVFCTCPQLQHTPEVFGIQAGLSASPLTGSSTRHGSQEPDDCCSGQGMLHGRVTQPSQYASTTVPSVSAGGYLGCGKPATPARMVLQHPPGITQVWKCALWMCPLWRESSHQRLVFHLAAGILPPAYSLLAFISGELMANVRNEELKLKILETRCAQSNSQ